MSVTYVRPQSSRDRSLSASKPKVRSRPVYAGFSKSPVDVRNVSAEIQRNVAHLGSYGNSLAVSPVDQRRDVTRFDNAYRLRRLKAKVDEIDRDIIKATRKGNHHKVQRLLGLRDRTLLDADILAEKVSIRMDTDTATDEPQGYHWKR